MMEKAVWSQQVLVDTPFAEKPVPLRFGELNGAPFAQLVRNGVDHEIAPHKVNNPANIWALKVAGVKRLLALDTVASLKKTLKPATIGVVQQYIDLGDNSATTFFEDGIAARISLDNPVCGELAAVFGGHDLQPNLTCVVNNRPRFNTIAESKVAQQLGGDIVCSYGMPEAVLAREARICYLPLAIIADYDAALKNNAKTANILRQIAVLAETLHDIIFACAGKIKADCGVGCCPALDNAIPVPSRRWSVKARHIANMFGVKQDVPGWNS